MTVDAPVLERPTPATGADVRSIFSQPAFAPAAKRIALVPEPSVRLNKSITMLGMQAAGVYSGLLLEGALGALAHSSHNEFREQLFKAQREHGLKAYLDMRDGPFQPEPMGPRSAKGRQKKAAQ